MIRKLISALLRRPSGPAHEEQAPSIQPTTAPAPVPRKPGGKRKYSKGKRHHPAPRGARKIDPNGPLIEQARQAGGIKQ
ncbi:hypothetical protein DPR00_21435 [Burkholderia pseudomallei]|uniref:hypothetical protein n=1 Tax=Burkholderia pseudomallei TaxID=28450 RepID=UPI0005391D52|nr:hypothetical protein [Burkholderia pseudomallei]KGV23792.1 hypothetical protein X894_1244 [Burkholderia pseudomallei MSHR4462]ONC69934.1 hypothetical protein AQ921_19740 [Burkholderia pseudomallei]RAP82783.1 hypothetical protein DPQ97_24560 [Burkholderia pseudomallei]RAP83674.1 hypothetical protein DPR01_27115 [Burkholderia pseudomallei]RAQ04774.1 hypothetical protein DPQ98_24060 [Burkholderia pseudomallei]